MLQGSQRMSTIPLSVPFMMEYFASQWQPTVDVTHRNKQKFPVVCTGYTWDTPSNKMLTCRFLLDNATTLPYLLLNSTGTDPRTRMYPVFFGESIEVNPKPETEIKCNSEVKYDSDRHYRDQVYCAPVPTVTSYSEMVVAVQNCTWRRYKSQVYLEPRQRPLHYQSTTIVYPKHAKNTYRTTLNYNAAGSQRWFVSTVQLKSREDSSPCIIYAEDL
uniref:Refilin A n=1 Tax=Oncorhynchus tshawytscha TaxID=74940 RepID=A0AAZ3SHP3_ONCTS